VARAVMFQPPATRSRIKQAADVRRILAAHLSVNGFIHPRTVTVTFHPLQKVTVRSGT
jgi:hypothetical protein